MVDRKTFKVGEKILHYLKENDMMLTRGVILVGNKTDLERHREVQTQHGRKLAKEIECKFIETSSGLDHNVDELLVGVVAQVKLNAQRIDNLSEKQRLSLATNTTTLHRHRTRFEKPKHRMSKISSKSSESGSDVRQSSDALDKPTNTSPRKPGLRDKLRTKMTATTTTAASETASSHDDLETSSSDGETSSNMPTTISSQIESPACSMSSAIKNPPRSNRSYDISNQLHLHHHQQHTPIKKLSTASGTSSAGGGSSGGGNNVPSSDDQSKPPSKISVKTKLFLTSFLKFKRTLRVKRRNSSSCSDLFTI